MAGDREEVFSAIMNTWKRRWLRKKSLGNTALPWCNVKPIGNPMTGQSANTTEHSGSCPSQFLGEFELFPVINLEDSHENDVYLTARSPKSWRQ